MIKWDVEMVLTGFTTHPLWMISLQHCTAGSHLPVFTACQQTILQQTDMWCMSSDKTLNSNNGYYTIIHWCMFDDTGENSSLKCFGVKSFTRVSMHEVGLLDTKCFCFFLLDSLLLCCASCCLLLLWQNVVYIRFLQSLHAVVLQSHSLTATAAVTHTKVSKHDSKAELSVVACLSNWLA